MSRFINISLLFDPEMPHLEIDPKKVITTPSFRKQMYEPRDVHRVVSNNEKLETT